MLIVAIRGGVVKREEVIIRIILRENLAFPFYFNFSYFSLLYLIIKAFSLISFIIYNFLYYT